MEMFVCECLDNPYNDVLRVQKKANQKTPTFPVAAFFLATHLQQILLKMLYVLKTNEL